MLPFSAISACALILVARAAVALSPAPSVDQCPALPKRTGAPANVSDLRIDDISVVGAIGDSITSALMAFDPVGGPDDFLEHRGFSFIGGGDPGATTVPNLVKHFNPNATGGSVGNHMFQFSYGEFFPFRFPYKPKVDQLNAAKSGAMSHDLVHMATYLVKQMKETPGVNTDTDWKLISIQIGANDQCTGCLPAGDRSISPEKFKANVRSVLKYLRANVRRVVVNLIGVVKVSGFYERTKGEKRCDRLRKYVFRFSCSCNTMLVRGDHFRGVIDRLAVEFNKAILEIRGEFPPTDDFALIVDPFPMEFSGTQLPRQGISDVDCFHPTVKTHAFLATTTFNNLFVPFDKKSRTLSVPEDMSVPVMCPDADDRIRID